MDWMATNYYRKIIQIHLNMWTLAALKNMRVIKDSLYYMSSTFNIKQLFLFATFKVLTAVSLRIQGYCDVTT